MNHNVLIKLAKASKQVYESNPVKHPGIETFISQKNIQVLIIDNWTDVIVAFRGTDSLLDWKTNFGLNLVPYKNYGKVHSGFLEAVNLVKESIFTKLKEYNKPLNLTGHSAGSAEAIIFALMAEERGFRVENLYTFGQPRCANQKFIDNVYYNIRYFRVVNQCDPIANSPPNFWFWGYAHAGRQLYFDEDSKVMPKQTEYDIFCDFLWRRLQGMVPNIFKHFLDQHSMDTYLENCKKLLWM